MSQLLSPPFAPEQALFNPVSNPQNTQAVPPALNLARLPLNLTLPAVSNLYGSALSRLDYANFSDLRAFLKKELDVTRLNRIYKHLKYSGLERPCRPLHTQVILGRDIWICEQADMHMLWEGSHIYIKPLPDFLLEHQIWEQHLCQDRALYQDAKGFLLSYIWLIGQKSDLRVAHDKGLIATAISWEHWIGFVGQFVATIDFDTLSDINIRYRRGELRLHRVNWIYRLCSQIGKGGGFFRSYHYAYHTYGLFIEENLTLLTTTIVYVALVLTAMQVGLATDQLKDNPSFNAVSYGFTVVSILAPLIIVGAVLLVTAYLVVQNWRYTIRNAKIWPANPPDHFSH